MENTTVKGRVLSVIKCMCSGIEVSPDAMPMASGALHAMNVAVSGQPISISGQMINIASGAVVHLSGLNVSISGVPIVIASGSAHISGVVLISGRVDLATKLAGEDLSGDVMKVVVMSSIQLITKISGQSVNISGGVSGQPVRTSGQAAVISGQQIRISGQQTYFQSGAGNIRSSGQAITINQAQLKSGLQCVSGRQMLTDIITDMKASSPPSMWRIMIAVGNAGQLNAKVKNTDCVSGYSAMSFNEGDNLTSGALYMFDVINQSGDELNLTYNTSAPIQVLRIHEITAGTQ